MKSDRKINSSKHNFITNISSKFYGETFIYLEELVIEQKIKKGKRKKGISQV